jgi:tRNA-splicing ligase RtcB
MNAKQLVKLGVPAGKAVDLATQASRNAAESGMSKENLSNCLTELLADPKTRLKDPIFGELAEYLAFPPVSLYRERSEPAPYRQWGEDLDALSIQQMERACRLPISVAGALMPDAHVGYGLPIGGVLATRNAVIPYAVGVDIACRMKLTVTDIPLDRLDKERERLSKVIERETCFGTGGKFRKPHDHEVLDADWGVTKLTQNLKERAHSQLGTSGSGNHFVELGVFSIAQNDLGLEPGKYVAILSHSGSRGTGAEIAGFYSRLARTEHYELPADLQYLAWLDMDSQAGQDYWAAMNLMGEYAAANHAVIHRQLVKALDTKVLFQMENHHNFAWKETHYGEELIVHRKGATPAGKGVLGIIPGSMATPCYLVRGLGNPDSLNSASHGAGRVMSRTQAKNSFRWKEIRPMLEAAGVTVLSAGIDENPNVYKNIQEVMRAQQDLVEILGQFNPKIVKMAPEGEKPED